MEEFPNRHNCEIRRYDRTAPPKDKGKSRTADNTHATSHNMNRCLQGVDRDALL